MTHVLYTNIKTLQNLKKYLIKTLKISVTGFLDNKLSIHFGDDKAKSILFASKRRSKNIRKLNIRYKEKNIKQQAQVTYLRCV